MLCARDLFVSGIHSCSELASRLAIWLATPDKPGDFLGTSLYRPSALRLHAGGVSKVVPTQWRSRLRTHLFAAVAVGVAGLLGTGAAFPLHSPATALALAPDALTRAQAIRADVNARYRLLRGRKLVVTAATSTGGASMLVLMTADWLEGRMVPMDNGLFFDTCSARARCPYPARWAAWPVAAFVPRRLALELALRTLLETSVSLVVVSLPTAQPVWAVFERDDLLANIDAPAVLDRLGSSPAVTDLPLRELVFRLTRPRLLAPAALAPDDSIVAVRLFDS